MVIEIILGIILFIIGWGLYGIIKPWLSNKSKTPKGFTKLTDLPRYKVIKYIRSAGWPWVSGNHFVNS